jgi:hypothetical protein
MRTTIDIADDVLLAAKELARRDRSSIGQVLSGLARQALIGASQPTALRMPPTAERMARLGIQVLPHRGGIVTNEQINAIRDEEGI